MKAKTSARSEPPPHDRNPRDTPKELKTGKVEELPEADIEAGSGPTDKQLRIVVTLAHEQMDLLIQIDKLTKELDSLNTKLATNMFTALPAAMDEIGIKETTLSNGVKIKINQDVMASITEANRPLAHEWLEKHKLGTLIKRKIEILFGREDVAWAKKFLKDCAKRTKPLNLKTKEWVEPQTLKAQVRRMREDAVDNKQNPDEAIPKDLFGVFVKRLAVVVIPDEN